MANHHITIAKASFAAACLRPDATQLTREDVSQFHSQLENTISKCSPSNIQTCKEWLVDHVAPSTYRVNALGKYLTAISKHIADEPAHSSRKNAVTLAARQKLHILYLLNDLLHHTKYHVATAALQAALAEGIQIYISELFSQVKLEDKRKTNKRLQDLLDIWDNESYFSEQIITDLRRGILSTQNQALETAATTTTKDEPSRSARDLPYIMPATHGDPSTPYYDLPAANMMPHIIPNRSAAMRPDQIKALQLSAGPADESLIVAVKDFLKDVQRTENPYQSLEDEGIVADLDELGQPSYRNEADELVGDTYYGWSREFCDKMKKRGHDGQDDNRYSRSRYSSSSRSYSRSRSRSLQKRRRPDQSRSASPSQERYRQRSRSRSRSPDRSRLGFQSKGQRPAVPQDQYSHAQQSVDPTAGFGTYSTQYPLPLPHGINGFPTIPPLPPASNNTGFWPPLPPPPPPPPGSGYQGVPFVPQTFYSSSNSSSHFKRQND